MPVYQYICDKCVRYYELQMDLATKDWVDRGKTWKLCPKCKHKLRHLIGPVRLSSKRATLGY